MKSVRQRELPQRLVDIVAELEARPGEADCVKLLVCKSAPIVWGMQRSVGDLIDGVVEGTDEERDRLDGFFRYLPEMNEFRANGGQCEERFKKCELSKPLQ